MPGGLDYVRVQLSEDYDPLFEYRYRDSNPGFRRERAAS